MTATHAPRRGTAASTLEAYLREISRTPLLGPAEEAEVALRVRRGDPEARDHLVRANLRLVVRVARLYAGRGLDLPDLIAEGNLGLLRAAEAFDPSFGTRFSTYAAFWVKQSIRRALCNTARVVRLPTYVWHLLGEWHRATAALAEELGRSPSDQEVAGRLKLPEKKLSLVKKAARLHAATAGQEGGEEMPLEELLADGRTQAPDAAAEQAEELREALRLVGGLGGREGAVLRLRFGLGGGEPMTLREVGRHLSLTRERVRQIELRALAKLREGLLGR